MEDKTIKEKVMSRIGRIKYRKHAIRKAIELTLFEVDMIIYKQINNYKELNKKFPKNQTFVDMWTALFALREEIKNEM